MLTACAPNTADCDCDEANGCETDLQSAQESCGACGNHCEYPNGVSYCFFGKCADICPFPRRNCDMLVG